MTRWFVSGRRVHKLLAEHPKFEVHLERVDTDRRGGLAPLLDVAPRIDVAHGEPQVPEALVEPELLTLGASPELKAVPGGAQDPAFQIERDLPDVLEREALGGQVARYGPSQLGVWFVLPVFRGAREIYGFPVIRYKHLEGGGICARVPPSL